MRSAKDRTIEKKRRSKAIGAKRTEQSRARRISNKHKRQEIHDIDPNLKVFVMNEKIYDIHGTEIEVIDGKIKPVLINGVYELDNEVVKAIVEEPVVEKKSSFDKLLSKIRRSK